MDKNKNLRLARSITKSIIKNSFSASAWIISALFQVGVLSISAFFSPSIYADYPSLSFELPDKPKKKIKFKEAAIRQSIWRLRRQGFVERKGDRYALTKKGRMLAGYVITRVKIIGRKWDGKFRIVIFDIPEDKRKIRDWLRQELYLLSYRKLQESVFIGKRPLTKDLIKEIKRKKIGSCVNYVLAEKVYKNVF